MQREQLEQLLSSNSILRSTFLMLYLKEELHAFGPIYLSECFPKEIVYSEVMISQFILNCRLFK